MGFNYGEGDYGNGLYSRIYAKLEGSLDVSIGLSGTLNADHVFAGTLETPVELYGDLDIVSLQPFCGRLNIGPAILSDGYDRYRGLEGTLEVQPEITGDFRNPVRRFEGVTEVSVELSGYFYRNRGYVGLLETSIQMHSDEFIGYMWTQITDPDRPWGQVAPPNGYWR